jgi:flagellar biosynthesis/type III secretory pathway protein FliH
MDKELEQQLKGIQEADKKSYQEGYEKGFRAGYSKREAELAEAFEEQRSQSNPYLSQ